MKLRVVIVEDQADFMLLLNSVLRDAGFEVIRAYGGQDAVRRVQAVLPDIVLTDLEMPKFGGVELIETLKNDPATRHIPIIAVTSHTWDELMDKAVTAGCAGFVGKPFDAKRLITEIHRCLAAARIPEQRDETGLRLAADPPFVAERSRH